MVSRERKTMHAATILLPWFRLRALLRTYRCSDMPEHLRSPVRRLLMSGMLLQVVLRVSQRHSHCRSRSSWTAICHVFPAVAWWHDRSGLVMGHLPIHLVAAGTNARDGWQTLQQIS